ncbi:hypothetical protein N7456_003955 [Penicillium angulare]|uniref:G-patch domain-containing protein n=1 Tax=Penicillium angulare TaxID=116970 RepID=A0A9W9KI32_9EURO|nr:hypothetical protein N7456_003955 [Penicillium angulare]
MASEYEDEDYFLPLEDQRVFGAGIRRKRVPFVRSGELNTTTSTSDAKGGTKTNVADTYLSIVLKKQKTSNTSPSTPINMTSTSTSTSKLSEESIPPRTHSAPPIAASSEPERIPPTSKPESDHCEICNLPLLNVSEDAESSTSASASIHPHEASLAHQVCLKHSHPPSHLDRTRAGMRYLSTYGWDPDSRLGLGAEGREGIREPLKGRVKTDTAGLGAGLDKDGDPIKIPVVEPKKIVRLNAKQMRKKDEEEKKKAAKMRNAFYKSDEVLKYLGEDA